VIIRFTFLQHICRHSFRELKERYRVLHIKREKNQSKRNENMENEK